MERSNVNFDKEIIKGTIVNKEIIDFNENEPEIAMNEETRELICISSKRKSSVKIQFSFKESFYKYSIRTNPHLITLKKGKSCEFENNLFIITNNYKSGKTEITQIINYN